MATSVEMPELRSNTRCDSHDAVNNQGYGASLNDDLLMKQIQENVNTTPWDEVLKRLASLPGIRRGKVMNIRCQIADGAYDVGHRLDQVVDRVLEDFTAGPVMCSSC